MKKHSSSAPSFVTNIIGIGIFPKNKSKLCLILLFFLFNFFSFNLVQAVDETSVEELIPNEFIGRGSAQGWNGDDYEWDYTLPFSLNFYGVDYTDIKIGSNGIICLDNTKDCDWYPDPLTETDYGPVMAPLGIDLRTDVNPSNDIYITENSDNVVIRWDAVEYGATDQINFEVVLYDNGNIKFNYGDFDADPDLSYGAIVGITKGDGSTYTNSTYNGNTTFNQVQTSAWGEFGMEIDFSPRDEKFIVPLDSNLQMTFDRDIYKGSGNIILKKASDDSVIEVIDVDSVNITGWGTDTITINPTDDFDYFTEYYVNIDGTAFKDISDEYYAGITDNLTWNFTTDSLTEVIESIPTNECYEVGSAEASQPANTTLTYSDDDRLTWTYSPVADGSGNDCNVTDIKINYLNTSVTLGEDLQAEFVGSTIDHTNIISEGNGKVVLDTKQIGTYTMGSSNDDSAWGVTTDSSGSVYYSGYIKGATDFDPSDDGESIYTPSGTRALFLTKMNTDYSYAWTRIINTDQYATINYNIIDTDDAGNVYMTGHFRGTVDFDEAGSGDVKISNGGADIFITKFSADGSYLETKTIGGSSSEIPQDIVVNGVGDMFITGYFYGTADFDDTAGVDTHVASNGGSIFVSKYNADGTYGWTRMAKGGDSVLKEGIGIAIDASDNVYTTGYFGGTIDLDGTAGVDNYTASGSDDAFITKYNSDGSYDWSRVFGSPKTGSASQDTGRSIVVNDSGEVFVSGVFHDTVDFDGTAGVDNITASNVSSIFLTKYNSDGSYEWAVEGIGNAGWYGSDIELYSDGVIMVQEESGRITRYDNSGNIVWTRITSPGNNGRGLALYNDDVYVAGGFNFSPTNFHTDGGIEEYSTMGNTDIYLAKHNVNGDYGFFFDGYLTNGTYKTQINSQGALVSWNSLISTAENPVAETTMSYKIMDSTCNTTLVGPSSSLPIDLSSLDVDSDYSLCLEISFATSDSDYSSKLDSWSASYETKSSNTEANITFTSNPSSLISTLTLAPTQTNPTDENELNLEVTFDQAIDGTSLTADDFTITGDMTVSSIAEIAPFDGTKFAITGTDMVPNTTITIQLPADKVQTLGGILNESSNIISLSYDTAPGTILSLAGGQNNPTTTNTGNFVLTFDEPINPTTLTKNDFDITGTLVIPTDPVEISPFDGTKFTFSGLGMMANTTIAINLPAGKVEDLTGNLNIQSNQISLTYSPVPATPVLENSTQSNTTAVSEGTFTIVFNKPINPTSLTKEDFDITGTIVIPTDPVEISPFDGTTFAFSGSGMVANELVTLVLPAGSILDTEGNPNLESNKIILTYDTNPTPVLGLALAQDNPTDTNAGNFVITFDEPINGATLTKDDFNITGTIIIPNDPVEISPFDGTTFAFSGSGMVANTTVTLSLPAGRVADLAGNLNLVSNDISLIYNTAPAPILALAMGQENPTEEADGNFVVTFDEPINPTTLTKNDFDITGAITLPTDPVEITPFDGTTFAFSGSGMVANTTVTLSLPAGRVADLAGNLNVESNTISLTYNAPDIENLHPVLLLAPDQKNPTFINSGKFKMLFNRQINPATFTKDDLAVTGTIFIQNNPVEIAPFNGKTFEFSGSGMVQDETITVYLPANKVQDLDGNYNIESNSMSLVYKVIKDHSPRTTGSLSGKTALRPKGSQRDDFRPTISNWTKREFEDQYEISLIEAQEINEGDRCQKRMYYKNHLGQKVFIGFESGRIGVTDFGGANGQLPVRFTGLFRDEEEFLEDEGGVISKEKLYNLTTNKINKHFVVNDFADIQTSSLDYEVVVKMNSLYLMRTGSNHMFRPRANLDWETLFNTVLTLKNVELESLTESEKETNKMWKDLQIMIKTDDMLVDRLSEKMDKRRVDQIASIFLTAHKYNLFEDLEDLRVSPTKQKTHEILEKVFSTKLRFLLPKQDSAISRIEFARMFVDGYDKYDTTVTRFNDTVRHLKHKFEEEKPVAPGNKRRVGSTFFKNLTAVDTVINARDKREDSTGKIYPHTVSLEDWQALQDLYGGDTKTDEDDGKMSIDYSQGIDGDGVVLASKGSDQTDQSLHSSANRPEVLKNDSTIEVFIETICPADQEPKEEIIEKVTKENFFSAPNYKVPHQYVVNDFEDVATGSPDYAVMVKMNSYNLMKSGRDHKFRLNEELGWETLFDSLLRLKKVDLEELTLEEKIDNELWQTIQKIVKTRMEEAKKTNPVLPEIDNRQVEHETEIIYTAYQYGLFEEVDQLRIMPTRAQVHAVLEKVFQAEIAYEFADEESPISRIEFARLFVTGHALIGNRLESIKNALERFDSQGTLL